MKWLKLRWLLSVLCMALSTYSVTAFAVSDDWVLMDVRTPAEYEERRLIGAVNYDFLNSDFRSKIETLDRNKKYTLYCRSGNRSGKAMQLMKTMGFKDVENLGSVQDAAKALNRGCEGKTSQC